MKSFPTPRLSTSMRPQETWTIRGGLFCRFSTVSMPSSMPGNRTRYSARRSRHPGRHATEETFPSPASLFKLRSAYVTAAAHGVSVLAG